MRRTLFVGMTAALVVAMATASSAYTGNLDPTFSDDGVVNLGRGNNAFVAARADGVVITAAQQFAGDQGTTVVLRATGMDGSRDISFSGDGQATPNLGNVREIADMEIDAKGRILLLGYAKRPGVIRLTADGRRDASFGVAGWVPIAGASLFAGDLTIDGDGRIVVVVTKILDTKRFKADALVARLLPGGRLDDSFGRAGLRQVDVTARDMFTEVKTDAKDRPVLAAGSSFDPGPLRVIRLMESRGRLDASFGSEGVAKVGFGDSRDPFVTSLSTSGGVTVGGTLLANGAAPGFAVRLDGSGHLDASFGGDGKVMLSDAESDWLATITTDEDGAVLAAGYSSTSQSTTSPVVAGLLPDGAPDTGLGPNGSAVLPVGDGEASAGPGLVVNGQLLVLVRSSVDTGKREPRTTYQLVRLVTPPT